MTYVKVQEGETVTRPADPQKEGMIFAGWYAGETEWNFDTPVTEDITLKAHWTREDVRKM